jgi:hypothetical protein
MADLAWPEKGVEVVAYEPMLSGNIGVERLYTIQGSGIYHGPVW